MTHISRKKLTPEIEKLIIKALREVFINLKPKEVENILSGLITKTEEVMLAKRLFTVIMLSEGTSYEEVADSLNLTNQTISRIHFEINGRPDVYKFLINKLKPWKRKELLKSVLKEVGLQGVKLFAKHAGGRIY